MVKVVLIVAAYTGLPYTDLRIELWHRPSKKAFRARTLAEAQSGRAHFRMLNHMARRVRYLGPVASKTEPSGRSYHTSSSRIDQLKVNLAETEQLP